MPRAKITYEYNSQTGKRVIHIDYQSDPDALAHEHEKAHARLVRELVGKGVLSEQDAKDVVVDRPDQKVEEKEAVSEPEERTRSDG